MNAIAQASAAPVTGPKLDNRRVVAGIVDLVIVVLGALVVLFAGDALTGDRSEVQGALSAVVLGWSLYYYFALESGGGQTVGKKLMKLRVVRADGSPVGMRETAVRTILRVVDGVGMYIVGLIVMLATGQRRQRIGDLAAGTIVIDASASSFMPAVAAPVAEAAEAVEGQYDAPSVGPVTPTITLPARPAPPATIDDLSAPELPEPEAPAVPEMKPFPPVDETPVAEEEPVVEEPVVEEPVAAEPLPDVTSPSLEQLAQDVTAVQAVPVVEADAVELDEPVQESEEPVMVKSVETVSAIDLIMGGSAEPVEEDSEESRQGGEDTASQ